MEYTLHPGDCLDIMPMMEPQSVHCILADIPYGTTACKWDTVIPFAPMWECIKRLIKPRGAVVLFGSQPFTSALVMSNPKWFKYCWAWDKKRVTGGANARHKPMRGHEDILVFSQLAPFYSPQMGQWTDDQIKRKRRHDSFVIPKGDIQHAPNLAPGRQKQVERGRHPDTVLRIPALGSRDKERIDHPTQKPVDLMAYLIRTYTNPGETVLDFTMGSGSTGVAAVREGRRFVGIEKDAGYFEIAQKRIGEATRQPALLEVA